MIGVKVKIRKSGNSTVLSISRDIQDLLGWKPGDLLNLKLIDDKLMIEKVREK